MTLHIFGIRHHGPGCARSLRAALEELAPDMIVVEGPADAENALPLAANNSLKPPVALLVYPTDEPKQAVYYPLADYSPEWQAIRWAAEQDVPVRFMDLPQSHQMAIEREKEELDESCDREDNETANVEYDDSPARWRTDALALLAEAAGFKDPELWWEQQIERRANAAGLFEAILEAMATVREEVGNQYERDLVREAFMRKTLRGVLRQGYEKVAVVCGAWHAPVLDELSVSGKREGCRVKDDTARLKGLPKVKTTTTWIPWTYSRLTYRSGYGAGMQSPGWYAHLWHSRDEAPRRWVATAARLLREKDLDASSASVIEAVRLADALAALRDLQSPGLPELNDAILSVLCHGESAPMHLIRNRLEIGDVLGQIPDDTPSVPLARDLAALQKRLRLKPSTEIRAIDLDMRNENDLARSHLFRRLALLGIGWGNLQESGSRVSTFREVWQIRWQPEFAVRIIEANVWGNSVEAAATAKTIHTANSCEDLAQITSLLDTSILAGLATAVDSLLTRIQSLAAVASDVRHLMDAVLPMARVVRYGDVRGTRASHVEPILSGIFERVFIGLSAGCSSLDEEAAERMLSSFGHLQQALDILDRNEFNHEWEQQLKTLIDSDVHALLRGWCCRLLLEKGAIDDEQLYRAARLALSSANPANECANWATGLLRGSGMLLLHQDNICQVFDRWLNDLSKDSFTESLPLLRRAFSDFSPAERRQMGEKIKHLRAHAGSSPVPREDMSEINLERAAKALPVLSKILGAVDEPNG